MPPLKTGTLCNAGVTSSSANSASLWGRQGQVQQSTSSCPKSSCKRTLRGRPWPWWAVSISRPCRPQIKATRAIVRMSNRGRALSQSQSQIGSCLAYSNKHPETRSQLSAAHTGLKRRCPFTTLTVYFKGRGSRPASMQHESNKRFSSMKSRIIRHSKRSRWAERIRKILKRICKSRRGPWVRSEAPGPVKSR